MKHLAIATILAAGFASSATAVNLEYGHEYETAYLQQCEREHSERACRCSMEALQTRIGFEKFAEQVERHGQQIAESAGARMVSKDLLARCSAVGRLQ